MILTTSFPDFYGTTMLPGLKEVFFQTQKAKPQVAPKIFSVDTTTKSIEQYSGMSGLGLFGGINEGGSINTDTAVQLFDKTFIPLKYGLGVGTTHMMVLNDKFGLVRRLHQCLAESEIETRELQAAAVINGGFADTGPDGVSLFSASHPLPKSGGTQANLLTAAADLDVTSLELGLIQWETMVKANGIQMSLPTPSVLVASANRFNAHEILKGQWRSDTAHRTINAFQYGEHGAVNEIIVWSKLTDPDAWFLMAPPDQTGLLWLWRLKPYTNTDYDAKTETAYFYRRYVATVGYYDWTGAFGTPGA
jgi:hypothetical protein